MTRYEEACAAIRDIFDAIPKGKFRAVLAQAQTVETAFGEMAALLNALRGYFLETTGEASPFVKKIDALLPRPAAKPDAPKGGAT